MIPNALITNNKSDFWREDDKIKRFSNINKDNQVPYFKNYKAKCDPVLKIEKRKLRTTEYPMRKPGYNMKCFKCKEKKKHHPEQTRFDEISAPINLKIMKECQARRKRDQAKYFVCQKDVIRLPSPIDTAVAHSNQVYIKKTRNSARLARARCKLATARAQINVQYARASGKVVTARAQINAQ